MDLVPTGSPLSLGPFSIENAATALALALALALAMAMVLGLAQVQA